MKEIKPFLLLLGAILVTVLIVPPGIIYNIGKAFFHAFKLKPLKAVWSIIKYWLGILYQLWNVVKYFIVRIAVVLDLIWNATSGELIEDCVTTVEQTYFGNGNITVSAATGHLEENEKLNKTGKKFNSLLSLVLGKNHSIEAWEKEKQFPINE